ncbi:unnamed protein product [Periconia digitata]|uniref:Uncharacterized protein n=1 Tax=Periconia digitata TaxID=1303443 RepID=A0A9W4UJL9_9PLEO|nr:unnamed protein product [Periconia digitata]
MDCKGESAQVEGAETVAVSRQVRFRASTTLSEMNVRHLGREPMGVSRKES